MKCPTEYLIFFLPMGQAIVRLAARSMFQRKFHDGTGTCWNEFLLVYCNTWGGRDAGNEVWNLNLNNLLWVRELLGPLIQLWMVHALDCRMDFLLMG